MKKENSWIRKSYCLLLLLVIVAGCSRTKNNKDKNIAADIIMEHYNNGENIPFHYDDSNVIFTGAFNVSPDYFAELVLNTEKGELTVFINGQKTNCELSMPEDKEDLILGLCISTEDLNNDGYMDFILTPNCSARFPKSYVHVFDEKKKSFVALKEDENSLYQFKYIDDTVGFITIDPENADTINKITFLNDNGNIWMTFNVDDYINGREIKWEEDFELWALDTGIGVFALRCIKKNDDSYQIVANENENRIKTLLKHKNIKFSTIEEHLLTVLIDFDIEANPIRKNPNGEIVEIKEIGEIIHPVEVNGDWIKIKDENEKVLGWIKWRNGNQFQINFYYSV